MTDLVAELRQEAESWKTVAESYENDRLEQKAEIERLQSLLRMSYPDQMAEIDKLRAALKPFADIGLDVLKERPGWANHAFSDRWAGVYNITYVQLECALAAYIGPNAADQQQARQEDP